MDKNSAVAWDGAVELSFGTATRKSPLRPANSDAALLASPLFAIADGSGEHGGVASQIAIDILRAEQDTTAVSGVDVCVRTINKSIYDRTIDNPNLLGMATTLTVMLFAQSSVTVAHVGDTRAYRARDGLLQRLTPDHRLVAELIAKGTLAPEDAANDPRRNVITRTLGMSPQVDAFHNRRSVQPGDLFLLTCDGVTDYLSDKALLRLIRQDQTPQQIADCVVTAAVGRGSDDDGTAVVIRYGA